jgi:hypothetical protein
MLNEFFNAIQPAVETTLQFSSIEMVVGGFIGFIGFAAFRSFFGSIGVVRAY